MWFLHLLTRQNRGTGAFACRCTRPWPMGGLIDQTRGYRIVLNVSNEAIQFIVVSHSMVEGFVLPEGLSGPAGNQIGLPRRSAFQPPHDCSQGNLRLQEHMNVIRHDHPGSKGILHQLCHANVFQPNGSKRGFVSPCRRRRRLCQGSRFDVHGCEEPNRPVARLQTGSPPPRVRDANEAAFYDRTFKSSRRKRLLHKE